MSALTTGETRHFAKGVNGRERYTPVCGAILTKWVSPVPVLDWTAVNCPACLKYLAEHPIDGEDEGVGTPTPRQKPPLMNEADDGVFEFYDVHYPQSRMEVAPQLSGNVEIDFNDAVFTLSHLDRADLIRALLHDFHYSPEKDGPHDQD